MSEPKTGLASLGLDNAIRLRWVLRDIVGKRLKFSPIAPNDLQTLIDLGYIEMKDDVPTVTIAGLDGVAIGNLPSRSSPSPLERLKFNTPIWCDS
jgi:hypothetical protein